ncbi:MAG: helix-turn-helix domain-containing protein [Candidatus Aenigmarchaeota archaeon]|nr:helix-turn-helix domain-containing protein [Candidatus Aenigmarchaeota archaeon]
MARKKGFDNRKIAAIIGALADNPDGLWLRNIARETSLHPLTVSRYLNTVLKPLVEETSLRSEKKPILRVVKLKPYVLGKLQEGRSLGQILRLLKLMESVRE